jgi:acyl-CoA synthetase (AMP-forming)/AMP-acid ligase II
MNFTQYLFENTRLLEKNFVNGNKEQISFSNLYDRSCRMASFLSSKEGTNKNILLVAGNNVFFITGYLGIMMSGNVCVPLDPTIEKRNLDYIIKECDADTILIESRLQDKFNLNALNILTELNYTKIINSRPVFEKIENYSSEKTAQIIFTSGSTGVPKGVVLSHRNLIANTTSIIKYLKLTENDIMEVVLPFYYCYGLSLLHTHLRVGGSVILNNNFVFLNSVFNDINKYKCTGFAGVPSHFQILLRKSDGFKNTQFPSLRYVTQAGGKLHVSFIKEFINSFPEVNFYVMYGQTEATARLSYLEPEFLKSKLGSIGKAIPGVELRVINEHGRIINAGETGEIIAKGDNIMAGYFKDDFATMNTVKDGWLYTGDIGTIDEEGYIYLTARKKEFLKISGKRVSPKEIEEVIVSHPFVVDCTIESIEDEITGEAVKAIVVITKGKEREITVENLKSYCADKLAIHKMPKYIEFSKELRLNSIGKKTL